MNKLQAYTQIDRLLRMEQVGTESAAKLLRLAKLANHCKAMLKNGLLTPKEAVTEFRTHA